MNNRFLKYTPEFLLAAFIIIFFLFKHPGNPWDRVINSDGKGYYAYLPALFIYHDLDYKFVEKYESKYYPDDKSLFKEFRINAYGKVVNKCFPGLAILWLPFFLAAHLLCCLFGFCADGYSPVYQYAIGFATLFYLWLGLFMLRKLLLSMGASEKTASFITILIAFGTNIPFYAIVEGSMSHIYSFSLITTLFYIVRKWFISQDPAWFIIAAALFILIILIRPTNGLILIALPFFAENPEEFRKSLLRLVKNPVIISSGVMVMIALAAIPLVLWHFQTGHWLVYSYGEEGFKFGNFRFFSFLFSYNRGWFLYTPIAFISLLGFPGLFRESKWKFSFLLLFLVVFVYITSSWWMWYYASKCSQRVMIDILAVVALLLLILFRSSGKTRYGKKLLTGVLSILLCLNILQLYQHYRFIFPPSYITKPMYWESIFSLYPKARVYLPEESVVQELELFNDMEKETGWMNPQTLTVEKAYSGKRSSKVCCGNVYSAGLTKELSGLFLTGERIVKVSAMVNPSVKGNDVILVFDFGNKDTSLCYQAAYLASFTRPGKWTRVEAARYVPGNIPGISTVKVYFYNPSDRPVYIDDIQVGFVTLKQQSAEEKIEGVFVPCH